jgi:hypothetical protein
VKPIDCKTVYGGLDAVAVEPLVLVGGVPHLDVTQPTARLHDDVHEQPRGVLVPDRVLHPPVQRLVARHLELQRVRHHPSSISLRVDLPLSDRGASTK